MVLSAGLFIGFGLSGVVAPLGEMLDDCADLRVSIVLVSSSICGFGFALLTLSVRNLLITR